MWSVERNLADERRSSSALVFPVRRESLVGLVVAGKTVDAGFAQDEVILVVLVLSAFLQVLPDGNSLLDQMVEVLGDFGGESVALEDAGDFLARDVCDSSDSVRIPQDDSDLRWGQALLGKLANLVNDFLGRSLEPCRSLSSVWSARSWDTFSEDWWSDN